MSEASMNTAYDRAQLDTATPFLVSAGAGAGKTYTLTGRYLHALLQPANAGALDIRPENILAITFTRKAANEMRERVRLRVQGTLHTKKVRRGWENADDRDVGDNEVEHLRGCLPELATAPICTFDEFCQSLLRRFPVEAGVDPEFALIQPGAMRQKQKTEVAETLETWLHNSTDNSAGRAALLALLESYDFATIRDTVTELLSLPAEERQRVLETPRAAQEKAAAKVLLAHPRLLKMIAEVGGEGAAGLAAVSVRLKEDHGKDVRDSVFGKSFDKCENLQLAGDSQRIQEQFQILAGCIEPTLAAPVATELDFAGVQAKALALLRNKPHRDTVLGALKLRHIFVDEFQDTNHGQVELIHRLVGKFDQDDRPLIQAPDAPRLFIVGDPKQAIYRFRGGEVELFARERALFTEANHLELQYNYRSKPGLLTFFNHTFDDAYGIFSRLYGAAAAEYEPTYAAMHSPLGKGVETATTPRAAVFLYKEGKTPEENGEDNAADADGEDSDIEAQWCAQQLRGLHGQENAAWRDSVILKYSVRSIDALRRELTRQGIPHYVVNSGGLADCQEVCDIIQWLRILARPDDLLALTACAKQPCIGFNDRELLQLKRLGDDAFQPAANCDFLTDATQWSFGMRLRYGAVKVVPTAAVLNAKLGRFQESLRQLAAEAGRIPAAELAERVVVVTGMRRTWAGWMPDEAGRLQAKAMLANIEQFLDLVRNNLGATADLTEAVAFFDDLADNASEIGEAQILDETDDVVRIMTIHQAKGLEFKNVFVYGIHNLGSGRGGREKQVLKNASGFAAITLSDNEKPVQAGDKADATTLAARRIEVMKAAAEKRRLFYVATTRASERLFVSGKLSGIIDSKGEGKLADQQAKIDDKKGKITPAKRPVRDFDSPSLQESGSAPDWLFYRFGMRITPEQKEASVWFAEKPVDYAADGTITGNASDLLAATSELPASGQAPAAEKRAPGTSAELPAYTPWPGIVTISPSLVDTKELGMVLSDKPDDLVTIGTPSATGTKENPLLYGNAFHHLMAVWDFTDEGKPAAITAAKCKVGQDTPKLTAYLEACLNKFCAMQHATFGNLRDVFASALEERRLYRELPFTYETSGVENGINWVIGNMDVVLEDKTGNWHIFDYKTGSQEPNHYATQMALYRNALKAHAGGTHPGADSVTLLYVE